MDAQFLLKASKLLSSTLDYDELLTRIVEVTTEAVEAETGSVLLYDAQADGLVFEVALGEKTGQLKELVFKSGMGIAGHVFDTGEPAIANEARMDPRFASEVDHMIGFSTRSVLCVPLLLRGATIGVVEAINKRAGGGFSDEDARLMRSLADLIAVAIENSRLYRRAKREQREKNSLLEVAKRINSALDLDEVLDMIADSMHEVIHYDALGIYLLDPSTQNLKSLTARGFSDATVESLRLKFGEGIVGWCIRNGESALVPDVSKDPRYKKARETTRSEIVAPLFIAGRFLGALSLESDRYAAWNLRELEMLKAFAGQVSVTIEKAMLHRELVETRQMEREISVAHRIQASLLPRGQPSVPGYEFAGMNTPSERVGGDYYDFIRLMDTQLGIVISDVSGKGIPAAIIMASFRASLLAEIRNNYAIRTILAKVGRLLRESFEPHHYVTAVYGVLDLPNRVFTYANAGHNPPVLVRSDGSVRFLKEGGLPLCAVESGGYTEKRLHLRTGDLLVFYTDGVSEAFSPEQAEFGLDRLVSVLKAHYHEPARVIVGRVIDAVQEFIGAGTQSDDVTLVAVKVL
ncbi:MAG: SpoIIE family protein phosphatase [Acidobacteriota bacterium]